ncbi:MAG: NAD(P)-dependent oxidoreductase [Verrucomicrobia bacterium]|nr:NAD(P)-dependent oxidoreductase [Verrucomicrobiota bacterium]MBU1734819.1 NAD(P)-dependent oxidoreductase [Verrucomicrobiota bacterium]MBU1858179.1 NAD(P)-dependent oxidoreductase [Verrucomicrobiota bacterium]
MKLLVTGGLGAIGRDICPELAKSHDVKIFDMGKSDGKLECIQGDIMSPDDVNSAMQGIDSVIHLVGIFRTTATDRNIMEVNVDGLFNVLEAAIANGVKRVCMASSIGAMGLCGEEPKVLPPIYLPVDENHPCRPEGMYGVSKLIGEELCKRYTRRYGLSTICLRLAVVRTGDGKLKKGFAKLNEDPKAGMKVLWSYIDSRDVARAFELAVEKEGVSHETFLISAKTHSSKLDWMDLVKTFFPETQTILNKDSFLFNGRSSLFDSSRAREKLGFEPKFNIDDFI